LAVSQLPRLRDRTTMIVVAVFRLSTPKVASFVGGPNRGRPKLSEFRMPDSRQRSTAAGPEPGNGRTGRPAPLRVYVISGDENQNQEGGSLTAASLLWQTGQITC